MKLTSIVPETITFWAPCLMWWSASDRSQSDALFIILAVGRALVWIMRETVPSVHFWTWIGGEKHVGVEGTYR